MGVEFESEQAGPGAPDDVLAFLIADVRGYTSFTRERGDAEAARLASRFADLAGDAVAARSGVVVEVRGDEVFAVFRSAAQAVRAALELQATLAEESAADSSLPLLAGIGIAAGEAVRVGDGYRGSALNLAARLCGRAAAGQVLLSEEVFEQASGVGLGLLQELGPEALKGFEEPVTVYEAVAAAGRLESPSRSAPPHELPIELVSKTPLVGREPELAWLRGTWRSARRGSGRIVFLSGGVGIGKTRLAAALAADVAGQGYEVSYSGSGGIALVRVSDAVERARSARRPTLVVLDDLHVTGAAAGEALRAAAAAIAEAPALVVGLIDDIEAAPALEDVVLLADVRGDGQRQLLPLRPADVAQVAREYAGDEVEDVPVESIMRRSGGVPAAVHELLDAWVREEASRRLEAAAEWLAAGQRQRAAQLEFANTAIERHLRRIYSDADIAGHPRDECPYKGLAPFGEDDAEWFYGRERLVGELAARTVATGLLAVVGPSGSGKSSVVRAGLLPSLAAGLLPGSRGWTPLTIRPGVHPRTELPGEALVQADPERRLVLVVDQFEEVFTLCRDSLERSAFIDALVEGAVDPERAVIILTIRGDFLDQVAEHKALAELVSANQVLVGPMIADEYRRAVEQPAHRCGVRIESALADTLVDEAVGQPGALPLLSTALVELWGQVSGGWLRMDAYRETGGLHGAVARLAEASYQQLGDTEQGAARRVFMRLAGSGEGDAVTRRQVSLSEFDTARDTDAAAVLDRFVADRLLTRTDDTVEVAHEALLREWPRLREWLADDAQGRQLHRHLTQSAVQWQGNGRRTGDLYRAERLSAAAEWSRDHSAELNTLEREFVAASTQQSQRSVRRLRAGLVAMAALLVLALVGGAVALVQRQSAQHEATVALGRQLGAEAVVEPRLDRAMLLAREAVRLDDSTQTESSLLSTLLRSPSVVGTFTLPITVRPLSLALAEHGHMLVVNDNNGELRLYDTHRRREIGGPIPDAGGFGGPMAVAPDSDHLLTLTSDEPGAAYIDLSHPARKPRLLPVDHGWATGFTSIPNPFLIDPREHTAYMVYAFTTPTGSETAPYVDVWNLHSGERTAVVKLPGVTGLLSAELQGGPGRERMLVLTPTAAVTYALPSFRILHAVRFHVRNPAPVGTLSPDGRYAAVGSNAAPFTSLYVIALRTGRITTDSTASGIENVAFSPHGDTMVTSESDREVQVWSPTSPIAQQTLLGHGGRVTGIAFSADGGTLYTSSLDGAVFRWNIAADARGGFGITFTTAPIRSGQTIGALPPLAVAPSGSRFATSRNATVTVWPTSRLTGPLARFSVSTNPQASVNALAWSPDGRRLLVGWAAPASTPNTPGKGSVDVWRIGSPPTLERTLIGHIGTVGDVGWSANGRAVAAITSDGTGPNKQGWLYLVNGSTGHALVAPVKRPQLGDRVAFSPDSNTVATSWGDNRVIIYSTSSGHVQRVLRTEGIDAVLAYSSAGEFATGTESGIVQLWNPRTGAALSQPTQVAPASTTNISFNPTGRTFVTSGGSDGIPKLWTTATLQQLGSDLPGDPGSWLNQAYTPDGHDIIVVSQTGRGWIWPATLTAWEQHACNVAGRNLTREEWSRYVTGKAYSRIC
jgi:WD40 repeat protein/class 3 adenylate cyclase